LLVAIPPEGQDLDQIAIDQVRFPQAPRNIHAIELFIVQLQPPLDIAQTCQDIISKHILIRICAIESS
jgi:hypothetical protein